MARKFLTAIDLAKNELQNAAVQNLGSAPSSPVKGQLYFNSTGGDNTLYWWDGSSWVPAKATGGAFPGYGAVPAETTFGIAKADGSATTVARSDHTHGSPTHDAAAHSTISLSALAAPTAALPMGSQKITSLGTPTTGTDAATKDYVDNLTAGLSWKEAVRAATTANITLSAPQTIDGVAVIANDRVLVKNQSSGSTNGIYNVKAGAWTRSTDADAAGELEQATVFIQEGTTLADTAWTCTTNAPIFVDTTSTTWVQFGAGTAYTAGLGLNLSGSDFSVNAGGGLIISGDIVQPDMTVMARHYAAACAASVTTVVNHAFATRDVAVDVYRTTTPWDTVECDVERTDTNNVTVRFATAPAAGDYRIVVVG